MIASIYGSGFFSTVRFVRNRALTHKLWLSAAAALAFVATPAARAQDWPADDVDANQGYAQPAYGPANQNSAQQPLNPTDLTQLVAPIALYPDTLVAQILAASTYPAQVSASAQWVQSMGNAPAQQVAAAVDAQGGWDPSVKALTAFPQVLGWMAQNMQWTTALGNAYYNQPQDVMQTLQVMRQRAQDAGTLQSTPQQQVYEDQGAINIAPADPDVVYVPTYDPWEVYGSPVAPYPGFEYYGPTWDGYFGFGPAIYLNAWSGWNWGWGGWGLDWWGCSIRYHNDFYWTRSHSVRDWGYAHGGPRWRGGDWGRGGGWDHGHNGGGNWGHGSNGGNYAGNPGHGNGGQQGQGFQSRGPASGAVRGRDLTMPGGSQSFNHAQNPQSGAVRQGFGGMQGQQSGRPSYNSGMMAQPRSGFADRGGAMNFSNPSPAPRVGNSASQSGFNGGYRGNYGGSARMPSYGSAPRSFSGSGQSYGGRSYSAPQAQRSYGGGQSNGGGSRPSFSGGGAPHSFSGGGGGGNRGFSGGGGGGHAPSGGGGGGGHHR
jgi:hypothetical protein